MTFATLRECIEQMGALVRSGDFVKARALGNSFPTPLAVDAAELALGRKLAEGAASTVWHGTFRGVPVAVKKVHIRTSADLHRFREELVNVGVLSHKSIVKLLAACALPPDYMLVMPLHETTLQRRIHTDGWRPDWDTICRVSACVASALACVHGAGLVHRDVKPSNILMGDGSDATLCDFGIAALQSELVGTKLRDAPSGGFHKDRMVGSLQYMSPEVLKSSHHSQASDVYAFAVAMNELASGTFPFADCTKDNPDAHTVLEMGYGRQELGVAVASEQLRPLLPRDAPPGWADLMAKCWLADPAERPSMADVEASLADLQSALPRGEQNGQPVAAIPDPGSAASVSAPASAAASSPPPPQFATALEAMQALQAAGGGFVSAVPLSELVRGARGGAEGSSGPPESDDARGGSAGNTSALAAPGEGEWESDCRTAYKPHVVFDAHATPGLRGEDRMEDRHVLVRRVGGRADANLLAVFDGHRGADAAEFAQAHVTSAVLSGWASHDRAERLLQTTFLDLDKRFVAQQDAQWAERVARMGALAAGPRPYPGCTALVLLQVGAMLFCGNVGDCRLVLSHGGTAVALTRDHTAEDERERDRVEDWGGSVRQVTRSLGDADAKSDGVTAAPEITTHELTAEDEFLVIASDGLWDKLSNEDAVALVRDTVKDPAMAAKRLATEALTRGSNDNITVVVCFLKDFGTVERVYHDGVHKFVHAPASHGPAASLEPTIAADEVKEAY